MKKNLIIIYLIAIFIFSQIAFVFSQQLESTSWNQFRGSNRNGISSETGLLEKWPESGPELVWKKEIGEAFSEIIISENIVYTMLSERIDSTTGSEFVVSYDALTGKELWKTEVDSIFIDIDGWGNGPRSTPTIDENYIYSLSAYGKLTAISKKDGKIIWKKDFVTEFGATVPRWGFSTSPMLMSDILVVEVGGTESRAFMAFDKKTGNVSWSKENLNATYSSPIKITIDGTEQILFANRGVLYSFNSKGDTLWTYKTPLGSSTALPLFIEPNKIFFSALGEVGYTIIQVQNNKPSELFQGSNMKNDFGSSCYLDGYIYGFNVAALQCISAETGETKWTKRGFGKGTLIIVDKKLLILSDQGKLILAEANPEAYTEKGAFQAITGKSWTAPSYSNGKVYVRNLTEIACYKVK